jgi:hypothetical protein
VKPLSKRWRVLSYSPDAPPDDPVKDGEKWARSLELHILMAQGTRQSWYGEYFSGDLFKYIANWKVDDNNLSVDALLKLLYEHRILLIKMRQDYAASFIAGKLPSSTIS